MSENRKNELKVLAQNIGQTEAFCPSCQQQLGKFPVRKVKCKFCGEAIYSRKEPFSGEKRLFKESDLPLFEELTHLKNGSWDWWNRQQQELYNAKMELAKEWSLRVEQISDCDARWRINQNKIANAIRDRRFSELLSWKIDSIRLLCSENKKAQALFLIPECLVLGYGGPDIAEEIGLRVFLDMPKKLGSPQIYLFLSVESDIGKLKQTFYTNEVAKELCVSFDTTLDKVWKGFENEVKQYIKLLAGNRRG